MAKKKQDTRGINCYYCSKKHFVKDGGWVITANGLYFCHSATEGSCLVKYNTDKEGFHGRSSTISEYWDKL